METINIEEFREVAERFIACRTSCCDDCQFHNDCMEDMRTGNYTPITDKLVRILKIVLNRLDERSQIPVDDFIALLKGE